MLTDLEYRVWTQYLLTADDFGVMHATAVALQNANLHLANRPAKLIKRCLDVIVEIDLVRGFDHQGQHYVFQTDWQRWQKVEFPRATINPAPEGTDLASCDEGTRALFTKHPGGQRKDRRRAEDVPNDSGHVRDARSDNIPPTRARDARETANGLRLTAHANGSTANGVDERFAEFWKYYPRKTGKGEALKVWQKLKPSDETLHVMLAALAWQKQQDLWVKDAGQFVPYPSTWLARGQWEDEPQITPHVADSTLKTARAVEEFLK